MKEQDAVLIWIGGTSGEATAIALGGRVIGPANRPDVLWIDASTFGQHLPQMYRLSELIPMDADLARVHGLCPDCLGYGLPIGVAAICPGLGIDQVNSCPSCGGTGRPAMRVDITRGDAGLRAEMIVVDHEPVLVPGQPDICSVCGCAPDAPDAAHQMGRNP